MTEMYIVKGIDPQGRAFHGKYNREDAMYLANCLNNIVYNLNGDVICFTDNKRTGE